MKIFSYFINILLAWSVSYASVPTHTAKVPTNTIGLHSGLIISESVKIKKGIYRLTAPSSLESAAIIVRGNNLRWIFPV